MRNDTCTVCGKKFEPREKKLYCSEKCKQYAYLNRKKDEPIITPIKDPPINSLKPEIIYTFNKKEFDEVKKTVKMNYEVYCFFRKNLSGFRNIPEIIDYINQFEWDCVYDGYGAIRTQFQEFQEIFYSGSVLHIIEELENIHEEDENSHINTVKDQVESKE